MQSWLYQQFPSAGDESSRSYLQALFQEHLDPGLAWLRSLGSEYIPSVDIALVTSLCTLLQVDFLLPPVGSAFFRAVVFSVSMWHCTVARNYGIPYLRQTI